MNKFLDMVIGIVCILVCSVSIFVIGIAYEKWRTSDVYDKELAKCREAIELVKKEHPDPNVTEDFLMKDCLEWILTQGD